MRNAGDDGAVRATSAPSAPSRRAVLGAAAALPLAAVPVVAAAADPNADAELLRLEHAIMAVDAEQARLNLEGDALPWPPSKAPRYRAIQKRSSALTDQWHALHEEVIDTSPATEVGRKAKARIVLRWVQRDADGWPIGEDAIAWSLARDVLGITEGTAWMRAAT